MTKIIINLKLFQMPNSKLYKTMSDKQRNENELCNDGIIHAIHVPVIDSMNKIKPILCSVPSTSQVPKVLYFILFGVTGDTKFHNLDLFP